MRVALVTGCAKRIGIGAAIARRLAATGVPVMVSDIGAQGAMGDTEVAHADSYGLDALVAEIGASGGIAASVEGDVGSETDTAEMVRRTVDRFGRLDILVNNASAPHGKDRAEIVDVSLLEWERVMRINATGAFLMCRAAVPLMRDRGWGRIINISSIVANVPTPRRAAYSASKAAVLGLTRSLAFDLAASGVTVNAICPGSIRTDRAISSTRRAGWTDIEAGLSERARGLLMKRHGEAGEVAALVTFLASESSAYITGQAITIDGGGELPALA